MGHVARGAGNINVGAVFRQVVINFQRIAHWRHTVRLRRRVQLRAKDEVCSLRFARSLVSSF